MNYSKQEWWNRFQKYNTEFSALGVAVDLSRMNVDDAFFAAIEPRMQKAFTEMAALEAGASDVCQSSDVQDVLTSVLRSVAVAKSAAA